MCENLLLEIDKNHETEYVSDLVFVTRKTNKRNLVDDKESACLGIRDDRLIHTRTIKTNLNETEY